MQPAASPAVRWYTSPHCSMLDERSARSTSSPARSCAGSSQEPLFFFFSFFPPFLFFFFFLWDDAAGHRTASVTPRSQERRISRRHRICL